MVAGRVALCFVSAGFDARVVHGVASVGGLKRWIGKYAYVVAALRQLLFLPRVPPFRVSVDATTPDGVTEFRNLLVSRILVYAGFRLFPGAAADPNHLQWYGFKGGTPLDLAWLVLRQEFEGAHEPHLATSLDILGAQPGATLHFQADGEAIDPGPGPFRVEVSPKPVWLLAPEGVPPGLSFDETESPS
jgi:diacylglycerol kinase family enzyme